MRILHIISALSGGGAETQIKLLLKSLCERNCDVGVLFLRDDDEFNDRHGISFYKISRGNKFNLFSLSSRIFSVIDDFKPDLVHTWLPEILCIPAALYSRYNGIPCLSSQRRSLAHNMNLMCKFRDIFIPINHIIANRVVTNFSYENEPFLIKYILKKRMAKIIPNAVQDVINKRNITSNFLKKDSFKLIYVGRLVPHKRVDLLIKAVAEIVSMGLNVQLSIYGEGVANDELLGLADKLDLIKNDKVEFCGYCSTWTSFATAYDCFVLPTTAEGMPNVLIEAMSLGLPTVTTSIYEISSLVMNKKHSLLVNPDSLRSLVIGIREIMLDSQLRQRIINGGMDLSNSFSVSKMADSYYSIYTEMLNSFNR